MESAKATEALEDEGYSSYGTADSEEEAGMDMQISHPRNGWEEKLDDMKRCIVALESSQFALGCRVVALVKALTSVQQDVAWVRGDISGLHDIMQNLDDHVRMLSNTVATVEGGAKRVLAEVSARGPWPVDEQGKEGRLLERTRSLEEDRVNLVDEEPSHVHGGQDADSAIRETQMLDINTDMPADITSLADDDGGGVYYGAEEASRGISAPERQATATPDEEDARELGDPQMVMTLAPTQTTTQLHAAPTWSEYTSTGGDMPPPTHGGGDSWEGGARSKRGRDSCSEFDAGDGVVAMADDVGGPGEFNLNLTPEKVDASEAVQGGWKVSATPARGPGSRGGRTGSGRGTSRVPKLPTVWPRYHTTVSD